MAKLSTQLSTNIELPVSAVIASGLAFPEGPAFAADGTLWCVELKGGSLVRIDASGPTRFDVGGAPNGIAFSADGRLIFCDSEANAVRSFDPQTGQLGTFVQSEGNRFLDGPNDLAFDRRGRLVFTCPGNSRLESTGTVWSALDQHALTTVAEGMFFPNGLAFNKKGDILVVAETYRQRLWQGRYDQESGRWIDPKPFADIGGPIGPDGIAFGADGLLYVAAFGLGVIKRVGLDGSVSIAAQTLGQRPTNCCFDPSGLLGLVVTEAERGELISFPMLGRGLELIGDQHAKLD